MPSRAEITRHAVRIFRSAAKSYGKAPEQAWLGIYCALLPHIIDADKLRRTPNGDLGVWQRRAVAVEGYVAQHMGCEPPEVRAHVDRLMRRREYRGLQRQNPLGIAFIGLVHYVLVTYGASTLTYEIEHSAQDAFPDIRLPGRSKQPAIDVLLRREGRPRAIVSVKWSLRHDRINDLTNECPVYKQAASWGKVPLEYVVVTNEYDPARLDKVLDDSCIDAVVHVHKPAVVQVAGLDDRLDRLLDLRDLFDLTCGL